MGSQSTMQPGLFVAVFPHSDWLALCSAQELISGGSRQGPQDQMQDYPGLTAAGRGQYPYRKGWSMVPTDRKL